MFVLCTVGLDSCMFNVPCVYIFPVQESICFGQLSFLFESANGNHWTELSDGPDL